MKETSSSRMESGTSSLGSQQEYQPPTQAAAEPLALVRQAIQKQIGESIPETKACRIYYIRGVGNDKYRDGEDKDVVIYGPEVAYVLDVGLPSLPTLVLPFLTSGLGDPFFPNFEAGEVRSTSTWEAHDVLFPARTGELIIRGWDGVTPEQLREVLGRYVRDIRRVESSQNLFLALVNPFQEFELATSITKGRFPGVHYAETNRIVRLIDFAPGWMVDRIA